MIRLFKQAAKRLTDFWFAPADRSQYAALRVGYAFLSLAQCLMLWPLRQQWFSSGAMISAKDVEPSAFFPSLFTLCSSETMVTFAFLGMLAAMACLLCGVLSRICAFVVFYWHYSLSFDLAPAISGYDMVLKLTGFILLFSPLGVEWGIFGKWRTSPAENKIIPPAPCYGLTLIKWQLICIYLVTVWLKVPDPYWRNGQLIAYFMMSLYSLFPSPWFAQAEWLSVIITYLTLAIELALPFLLLIPRSRFWGVVLGLALHIGIAVTSNLWLFSFAMLMMYPAFVSSADLKAWTNSFRKGRS